MGSQGKHAPRNGKTDGTSGRFALLVFVLALLVRLVYLAEISKSPTFHIPVIDSATYDEHARSLLASGAFGPRFFWQGFFYPFYLATVYLFTGGSMLAARLIQVVLGSLMCAGVCRLGARMFGRGAGIAAGVITALYGPLVFYDVEILDAGFSAIWAAALIGLMLRAERVGGIVIGFLVGACGALSVVTRATFLPFFIVACAWLMHGWRAAAGWKAVGARGGLIAAGFLLVAVPVSLSCRGATGDFNFLAQSGPINLYIGNNPDSEQTIMIRPGAEWRELTRMPMVKGSMNDAEDKRVFMRLFRDYVRKEPGAYVAGLARKTAQFASSRELPRNDDLYLARSYSKLLSALVWKAGGFGFPFGVLLPLALVGIARHWRRIPIPVYLFLVLYPAAIIAVFVSGRYRVPIVPILALPAAAGLVYAVDLVRAGRWRVAALAVAAMCAAGAATSAAGPFAVERYNYAAEAHTVVGFELMKQNRMGEALGELSEALRLDPDWVDAHKYSGIALSQMRRHAEAAEHLRAALEREPDSYLIRYYLGVTLLNLGRRGEARELLEQARAAATAAKEDQLIREIDKLLRSLDAQR